MYIICICIYTCIHGHVHVHVCRFVFIYVLRYNGSPGLCPFLARLAAGPSVESASVFDILYILYNEYTYISCISHIVYCILYVLNACRDEA